MNRFSKNRRLFLLGLGILVIVGFFSLGIFRWLSKSATSAAQPAFSAKKSLRQSFANLSFLWQSKKSLLRENKELAAKLAAYQLKLTYADFVATENEQLKSLLGFEAPLPTSTLAPVLAGPKTNFYDTLLVDLGTAEVAVGAKVFLPPKILLGEVAAVSGRVAKARLYSTPAETIEAKLANSGTPVNLVGRGGGNFKITLPREIKVALDEPVVFPPDFLLGFVKKIDNDPREPEQMIYVSSPINIFSLQYVFIEK